MAKPWIYRRCGIGKTGENPETHEQYEMCPRSAYRDRGRFKTGYRWADLMQLANFAICI